MEKFGKFMASLMMVIILVIVSGYTLSILWSWFITPTFDVKELTVIQAIGLSLVKGYLFFNYKESSEAGFEKNVENFIKILLVVGVTLGFGWIYHQFM